MTIGKRITAFCLALCMTASLSACSSKDKDKDKDNSGGAKETVSLKVWGPQEDQAVLKEMVDSFKQENTDKNYDIKLAVVGEKDTKMLFMCAAQTVCPCAQRFFLLPKMPLRCSLTASFIDSA